MPHCASASPQTSLFNRDLQVTADEYLKQPDVRQRADLLEAHAITLIESGHPLSFEEIVAALHPPCPNLVAEVWLARLARRMGAREIRCQDGRGKAHKGENLQ